MTQSPTGFSIRPVILFAILRTLAMSPLHGRTSKSGTTAVTRACSSSNHNTGGRNSTINREHQRTRAHPSRKRQLNACSLVSSWFHFRSHSLTLMTWLHGNNAHNAKSKQRETPHLREIHFEWSDTRVQPNKNTRWNDEAVRVQHNVMHATLGMSKSGEHSIFSLCVFYWETDIY